MDEQSLDAAFGPRLNWQPVSRPPRAPLTGTYVTLKPLNADRHAAALYRASHGEGTDPLLWLYLQAGPWQDEAAFTEAIRANSASTDPQFYAVIPADGEPAGQTSYLRIDPTYGVIEIGHIWFGSSMQRSPAATEAIYLMARHALDDLGYRRLEWKCNALNQRSRRAAVRFGFTFEGIFRKAIVVRDRNRDTAWYSIVDDEWPAIRDAFEAWLNPGNFDEHGRQRRSLQEIRGER